MSASRIERPVFESSALKGNPLGDPHARAVPVYLPPGYDGGTERYPVAYLLAGFTGKGEGMLGFSAWEETIQERMDRLIASGTVRPMILVLPDGFTRYGGSQYLNSSAVGRYEDYLMEVVSFVDGKYRTRAAKDCRAVAGKSSGGYGALVMGMKHPDLFGLVADHSGDKYFEMCYKPDFPKFLSGVARYKDVAAVLKDPAAVRPRGGDFFYLVMVAAMAACYSPNPEAPLGFDLPFDSETGELDEAVWKRWLAHDPVYMVDDPKNAQALQSLRLLFMDCGNRDEYHLQYGARILSKKLKKLGIAHHYEEFNDGHRGISYRYDVSLAAISAALPA